MRIIAYLAILLLGAAIGYGLAGQDHEQPGTITELIPQVLAQEPIARASPADRVSMEQIFVYGDKVVLDLKDAQWAQFTDTHSMEPVLSATSNAIEIIPRSESEIKVGDIVSYESEYAEGTFIHRIIQIGQDERGWYCIMKGDNNPSPDPGRVRFSQLRRVVVGIIY